MNFHAVNNPFWEEKYEKKIIKLNFGQKLDDLGKITFWKLIGMCRIFFEICHILIFYRPSLIYFTIMPTGKIFYRDAIIAFICKFSRSKIVMHLHGKGIDESARKSKIKTWLYRQVFKNTNIICLSEKLVSDIGNVYNGKPFVLANGINTKVQFDKRALNIRPVVIYLSNLVKSKGIEVFLQSVAQLKREKLVFEARIIGDAADYSFQEAGNFCKENNLDETVKIVGPKFNEQKMRELYDADIFVLPSFNECFPLTILEAMQAGLPIIATKIGGIPDMITNNQQGFLVDANDQHALAEKIRILVENRSLREEFGSNARKRFYANFTINHFYDGLNAIFNKVLNA